MAFLFGKKRAVPRALYLDDLRPAPPGWEVVRNVDDCVKELLKGDVALLSLDHDLGDGVPSGYDLAKIMAETGLYPTEAVYIHTDNPSGRQNMLQLLTRYAPEGVAVYHYPCPGDKWSVAHKEV